MRFIRGRGLAAAISTMGVAALLAAGCGGSDDKPSTSSSASSGQPGKSEQAQSPKTIAYANIGDGAPIFKGIGDGLQKLGEADGVKVIRFDNKFDPAATLQNARQMVELRPDVFVEWSPVADVAESLSRQFKQSGKPCVAVNSPIPGCPWLNISNLELGRGVGPVAAKEAVKRGWKADDTTVVVIGNPGTGKLNLDVVRGFYERFAPEFPGQQVVAPDSIKNSSAKIGNNVVLYDAKGQVDIGNRVMQQALQGIPKGRHIVMLATNDESGMGAIRAVDQAGRSKDTVMVSLGGSVEALAQLRKNPAWVGEGAVFTDVWPSYILALAKAVHAGAKTPELTPAPQLTITKDNVDEYFDAKGKVQKAPPIPADAEYLQKYGLGSS
jgi:ribose transport system substrate-binding protein